MTGIGVPGQGRLILVVEDEPLVSEVLEAYLRREGFRTRTVSEGDEVVEAVRRHRPDALLLDVTCPVSMASRSWQHFGRCRTFRCCW